MVRGTFNYGLFPPENNLQCSSVGQPFTHGMNQQFSANLRPSASRSNQQYPGIFRPFAPTSHQQSFSSQINQQQSAPSADGSRRASADGSRRASTDGSRRALADGSRRASAGGSWRPFAGGSRRASVDGSQRDSPGIDSPGISSRNTPLNSNSQSPHNGQDLDDHQDVENEQSLSGSDDEEDVVGSDDLPRVQLDNDIQQPHLRHRQKLDVIGKSFEPLASFSKLRRIIHCHFKGPWISFRRVPKAVKLLWLHEFKKHYWWDTSKDEAVRTIWRTKASEHLRTIFSKCNSKSPPVQPDWIDDEYWAKMLHIWATDKNYKQQSEISKKVRASDNPNGSASYTGGSISVYAHVKKYRSEHDNQDPTMEELMQITYQKKGGGWSGARPKKTMERYHELVAKAQEKGEEIDHMKLWIEAAGGVKKGSVFGLGSNVSDLSMELLQKYSFSEWSEPYGTPDSLNEVQQNVCTLQSEVHDLKDQLKNVATMMEKFGSQFQQFQQFQLYAHQQHYASSAFPYPPAPPTHQHLQNHFPNVAPSPFDGEVPTSFTNLLNSNFLGGMTMPTHPMSAEIPRNTPRDNGTSSSMSRDSQGADYME